MVLYNPMVALGVVVGEEGDTDVSVQLAGLEVPGEEVAIVEKLFSYPLGEDVLGYVGINIIT